MRIRSLTLKPYGECSDLTIELGTGLTVVLGANEAGKSTALDALTDLLWGIPAGSRRDSRVKRKDLRILATVQIADDTPALIRKADGLFAEDQLTRVAPPWDLDLKGERTWWRTRFGISHEQLRNGGREVFLGQGNLAELVFAAREGGSARVLREEISKQVDALFKSHRGARSVALRKASADHAEASRELAGVLTQADSVRAQRAEVEQLERDYAGAKSARDKAARALQQAREDTRVIAHVLALRAARSHCDRITQQGGRLLPEELAELEAADGHRRQAQESQARLTGDITDRMTEVEQLRVEEPLLAAEKDIDRLAASLEARLADLSLADSEYLPDLEKTSGELRRKLLDIGVDAGADLDEAVAATRVRADYAAALYGLAGRHEALTVDLEAAGGARAGAESALLGRGIHLDPITATVPDGSAVSAAKGRLTDALASLANLKGLEEKARQEVTDLEASAPSTAAPALITREDVDGRRFTRDQDWLRLTEVWLTGDLPEPPERSRSANRLTEAIAAADSVGDREADERERLAGERATAQAHVAGLARKHHELTALIADLERSQSRYDEAQRAWAGLWQSYGVAAKPDIDHCAQVLDLLRTWHRERFAEDEAAGKIADLEAPWRSAAELAGLRPDVPVAVWRTRAEILEQIDDVNQERNRRSHKESEARTRWATYATQSRSCLTDLAVGLVPEASPARIEAGILGLQTRLVTTRESRTSRDGLLQQVDVLRTALSKAGRGIAEARLVRTGFAQTHRTDEAGELDALAQRAREAQGFVDTEVQSLASLRIGVDAGSDLDVVIGRLGSADEVAVKTRLTEAEHNDDQKDDEAARALERLTTARNSLTNLEGSGGAAEAQAAVASHQARVARLTEQWAALALQRHLLDRTLDTYGSKEASPLLRHAGEILERLTAGRWVALSARDDQGSRSLRVLRCDGEELEPSQLSEGTADQVFLALRLAAVAEQHEYRRARGEPALPFVLDDALMAFDDGRTVEALTLLHELAEDLQVVVFTHHAHVAAAAANLAGAVVSRMAAPEVVSGALNARELRDRVPLGSPGPGAPPRSSTQAHTAEVDPSAVRVWARAQAYQVAERGRVSQDLVDKYVKAHQ
jgi:hypothetical protein